MTVNAPWLPHYDPGVPPTLAPYPNRTLVDYLADAARDHPRQAALLFKGATITYADLERLSDACAAAFQALGVTRGDRIALLLPNCPQFVIAQFAAWKLGAIVAPLNPLYTEQELEGPIREHGIETVVTLTRFYARVKQVQRRVSLRRIVATNIKEYFPPLLRLLFTIARETRDGDRVTLEPGDHNFAHLIGAHQSRTVDRAALTAADPAVLLMSGGTTGTPKGVLGTHGAYVTTGLQLVAWTKAVLHPDNDVIFLPLPLFHVYGNVGVQALAFVNRNPIALVPNPRDLDDLVATIRRVKPAFFNGVPTLYIGLLNRPDVQQGRVDFKSITICFSGSAPLLAETKQRFEAMTGGRIIEGYSLTEAMMACCVNPVKGASKIGSVGMPLPDVRIRILDADEGTQTLAPGEVGEVVLSAPQLMAGYWNRPDETAAILRDHVDGTETTRWLHTGDLGYLDTDGYLFIVDRKKDLIKTSGYQVWPREIEEVLATHRAVAEVGVAGVPDAVKGEAVKAWVVLRKGESCTDQDLRAFCREHLAPYKVPASVEFRTELPKTMVGKVLRRALKEGK
ncbi:MAG: AMP-dependent synthetase [Acidobacteria bacterium RIFCSPLOWO2_12_FULL_65_11]|nr:MAG: AMP-dependent synthetase [Acidobacteria bacterium RIFCSPLOWO2_02_FULL_64_15]OFW33335.1 MAG: AMP-dependent synthetase [Acidobacteria bacterium RIFCSPLOWO2_12_FULL_65_11]